MLLAPRTPPAAKAAALRRAIAGGTVVLPGCFNAAVALVAQKLGFGGVYVSGAGLSNGLAGYPDIGLLGMEEVARAAGYIANAVEVPALADADTGFGEAMQVMRTVQAFEAAGLAGIHLEDQVMPKRCGHLDGKRLVPASAMEGKLAAAVAARRNPDFLLVARTDARAVEGFAASVERGLRYLEAGADAVFIEALETEEEFGRYAEAVKAPLLANLTEFGRTPPLAVDQLARLGYAIVIFPMTAFRVMMKAVEGVFAEIRDRGTPAAWLERMQTRAQLYDLLRYGDYTEIDHRLAARLADGGQGAADPDHG